MFDTVLFDLDDTIWNYSEADSYACQSVFEFLYTKWDISLDISFLYKHIVSEIKSSNNINNKHNKTIYFKKLFEKLDISLEYLNEIMDLYHTSFYTIFRLEDKVKDLFILLKKHDIKIGIVSNNHFTEQLRRLSDYHLLSYIDTIITTDEIGEEKPVIHSFLYALHKLNTIPENTIMIGDNLKHDIYPSIDMRFGLSIYISNQPLNIDVGFCSFKNIQDIFFWMITLFDVISKYKHLCNYFSQSYLNNQGSGGNISIKLLNYNMMMIKSSGSILSDMEFCLVDIISGQKIMGKGKPSIETFFHCKLHSIITIHLHFLPANIFLCSDYAFKGLRSIYKLIPYLHPGKELAEYLENNVVNEKILLLKNHGIVLCSTTIEESYDLYKQMFFFFNTKCNYQFDHEYTLYQFYHRNLLNLKDIYVCNTDIPKSIIRPMIYCFPDLVVFFQQIHHEEEDVLESDIIISREDYVYLIGKSIKELQQKREILYAYMYIYSNNPITLHDTTFLINMPEETYRKKKLSSIKE